MATKWLVLLCAVMLMMSLGKQALAAREAHPYKMPADIEKFIPEDNPAYLCYYDKNLDAVILCHLHSLPWRIIIVEGE